MLGIAGFLSKVERATTATPQARAMRGALLLVSFALAVLASESPKAAPECALLPDPGNCSGFFRRFYYNRWTGVSGARLRSARD